MGGRWQAELNFDQQSMHHNLVVSAPVQRMNNVIGLGRLLHPCLLISYL